LFVRIVVANFLDDSTRYLVRINGFKASACDFAHIYDNVGSNHGFTGNMGGLVGFYAGVKYGVGYLVCDFVRMPLGYRFGSKYVIVKMLLHGEVLYHIF
jgi:hypothetical protein